MRNVFIIFAISCLLVTACGDDDGGLPPAKNYAVEYKVTASGGTTVTKIQYRDKDFELVVIDNPSIPWEVNLSIPAGKAIEAKAFGDVPFEGDLRIEANWSPAIDGESAESQYLKNEEPNSIINNGDVEIEGRSLPRY